jgi:hypothetical protein
MPPWFPETAMQDEEHVRRRAASERDAARARVRRITGIVLAASLAVAGSLAGYVASAASGRKTVRRSNARATTKKPNRTAEVGVPATPAPPALIPSGSPPEQSSPQPPAEAPAQTQAPPAAVSGGS